MLHARNANRDLSFATIGALAEVWQGGNTLLRLLDNAGQTVVTRYDEDFNKRVDAQLEDIAAQGGWKLSKQDTADAIQNLYNYHARISGLADPTQPYGRDAPSIPKKDFQRFYSLIYHLIPEEAPYGAGRETIAKVFEKLELDPPLAIEKLAKDLPAILELGDPKKLTGRSHG